MSKIVDLISQILFNESEVFIGNIIHSPWPYEVKQNEWGGFNFKYKVPDGFKVETIDDSGFHQSWEEIESLSVHTEIPAYLVTYTMPNGSCRDIICSPKNSILIYNDNGEIVKADMRKDLCVGKYTPCKMKNKKNSWISKAMITSVDYTGESMTMYDVTLKNNKIFLADDSLFVYDTVATHIPIGKEAIEEAKRIMPSYQLYDDVSGKVIMMPDHNAAVGLYLLSKTDKGREKINSVLPENLKISSELKKPALAKILADMAKADTKEASKAIDFLRKLGDDTAYEQGVSFGISDIAPMRDIQEETVKNIREEIRHLSSKEKTNDKINAIYKKHADIATDKIEKRFNAEPNNKLGVFLLSRARGSASQIRDIVVGPLGVQSANQTEIPISHSYAEGLTPAEAFMAAEGARKGVIGKSQETAMPGALGKEVLMTTNTFIINKQKGNSMNVIEISTDNPNDILDRYTGRDIDLPDGTFIPKDSPVDTRLLKILYKNKIDKVPVYTPLQSSSRDGGLPAMAYGNMRGNSLPEVGFNIGSNSSHGIVKPLFTESMNSFHCFHGDVSVYTEEREVRTLEDLYNDEYSGRVLDIGGNFVKVVNTWKHEVSDTMALSKTKDGHSLIAQLNHPMQITKNVDRCLTCGHPAWSNKDLYVCASKHNKIDVIKKSADVMAETRVLEASDINDSAYILIDFPEAFGSKQWDWGISPYMLGAHIAEGSYRRRNNPRHQDSLIWSQSLESEINARYKEELGAKKATKAYILTDKYICSRMIKETGAYSHDRKLPYNFLNYSKESMIEMLAGIIDGDAHIVYCDKTGRHKGNDFVRIDSTSYALVSQIQILCSALGISSNICPTTYRKNSRWQPYVVSLKLSSEQKECLKKHSTKLTKEMSTGKVFWSQIPSIISTIKEIVYDHKYVYDVKTESGTFVANGIWTHNTGGSVQDKMRGYPRLKHILEMTKEIPSKATLSDVDGTVESIERDSVGGFNVYIDNRMHYLNPGIEPNIKIGDSVKRGDALNDGLIDPRDIFERKSLLDAQNYMVDELVKNTPGGMRRRAAEVVVEAITRHGEIIDGGDSEFLPGDKVLIPEIEAQNKDLERKIKYKPLFKGVNLLPQNTQSWMSQLNFRNLDKTMKEAVMFGKTTDTHSYEPVPAIATGKNFGQGDGGKY